MRLQLLAKVILAMLGTTQATVISSPISNRATHSVASVGVGSPATNYDLIVDTGSSNTWVGASQPYMVTSTSYQTSDSVSVSYSPGSFSGTEYIDQVTLAAGLVVPQQSIGVASTSNGFVGVDGVLGLGPVGLSVGTLSPDTSSSIPTVTDNFFSSGAIPANVVGISLEPITDPSGVQTNGELSWGGTDPSKYTGAITFTPITSTSPASSRWGLDASFVYGGTNILSSTAGIIDTSTALLRLATDAFTIYQSATGGVLDHNTSLLKITSSQYAALKPLDIVVSGVTFTLSANAQIWPRNLNALIGGTTNDIYLVVGDIGTKSGSGIDFILGHVVLERFYTVLDTANQQIGLATTSFTEATTN